MHRRAIAALGLGVLALSGCSADDSGQAAVSDTFRISQEQVAAEVGQVLEALGRPAEQPPAGLASETTQRLVQDELIAGRAAELGVEVTQGQVEKATAELATQNGGMSALEDAALQSGIPRESIDDVVRTRLLITGMGAALAEGGDGNAQSAAVQKSLVEYSAAIDVQVAPRYGTWDDETLSIKPGSSVVEPASPEPTLP